MKWICSSAAIALFALAGPAYAQDAPLDTYGGPGSALDETTDPGQAPSAPAEQTPAAPVQGEVVGASGGDGGAGALRNARATTDGSSDHPGGALPFTGADISLMLLGGIGLLIVGIGVRRLSHTAA